MPDEKCFYNSVKDETTSDSAENVDGHISDKDYLTCKNIWNKFDMKNMGDYDDHYLKKDVLLLAHVFERFIDTCLQFYRVDPCYCFISPGLSWDAMLKLTGVKLEKIFDIDMYLFIEKGLRGGIPYIAKKYSKVNTKYMKNYDPKKPSNFITYLDMNNLYGWAMNSYLPYGGFNVDGFDVNSVSEKSPIGYILEAYLEYLDELHVLHNDYPLAPEKLYDMLSTYCKKVVDKYEIKVGDVKILIPNLDNKTNYVINFRNPQLRLS